MVSSGAFMLWCFSMGFGGCLSNVVVRFGSGISSVFLLLFLGLFSMVVSVFWAGIVLA